MTDSCPADPVDPDQLLAAFIVMADSVLPGTGYNDDISLLLARTRGWSC
jgi:hypothetical protein